VLDGHSEPGDNKKERKRRNGEGEKGKKEKREEEEKKEKKERNLFVVYCMKYISITSKLLKVVVEGMGNCLVFPCRPLRVPGT
jgi:hypothetical protein